MSELARRATVFFFPLYEMWRTRWHTLHNPDNPRRGRENAFAHARMLSNHRARVVTTPNNDTLYSNAWLDLSQGPLILSVPDTGDRYYSLAFMDAWTNNFAYVGRRTTGTKAGRYLVVGPDWPSRPPDGHAVVRAPTHMVWLLGRTVVDGPHDLDAAGAVMRGYTLEPSGDARSPTRLSSPEGPVSSDPADAARFFDVIRHARIGNAEPSRDQAELAALTPLRALWSGAGLSADDAMWPDVRAGYTAARQMIRVGPAFGSGTVRNGWGVPPASLGNFGIQYGLRAIVALTGLAALEPAEAMYMTANVDADGQALSGAHRYVIRFEKDGLPPVDAFWSLSMYEITPEGRAFFVDNPLGRYAIGDRTRHLMLGADGALELYVQKDAPGGARDGNWLPAPDGPLRLTFRAYQPRAALLEGRYTLPPVRRVG